jgi:hypothetical protein
MRGIARTVALTGGPRGMGWLPLGRGSTADDGRFGLDQTKGARRHIMCAEGVQSGLTSLRSRLLEEGSP